MSDSSVKEIQSALETLESSLVAQYERLPIYTTLSVEEINPNALIRHVLEVSRVQDAYTEFRSELALVNQRVKALRRCVYGTDDLILQESFLSVEEIVEAYKEVMEFRSKSVSTHMQTLRSLVSAINKNPSMADQVTASDN